MWKKAWMHNFFFLTGKSSACCRTGLEGMSISIFRDTGNIGVPS